MESELHVNVWHPSKVAIHKVETDEENGDGERRPKGVCSRRRIRRTQQPKWP
uniref:Uncharacterized protein n=1 Tax=Cucumis melo TaxID=3656 RepID=A0A9I9DC21_CUCME